MTRTSRAPNAATAVVNTNLATVSALLTWVLLDMFLGKEKKPTFLGAVNGMIVGLVAITPGAGYVNGFGAMLVGRHRLVDRLVRLDLPAADRASRKVDDAMGVVYTHGIAGLLRRPAGRDLRRPERGGLPEDRRPARRSPRPVGSTATGICSSCRSWRR